MALSQAAAALHDFVNQYKGPIGDKFIQANPILALQPAGEFKKSDGYNPNVLTLTHDRPTSRLQSVANIDATAGTAGFNLNEIEHKTGERLRSYTPYGVAFYSQEVNVEDLSFNVYADDHVENMVSSSMERVDWANQDNMRTRLTDMVDLKMVLRTSSETYTASNTNDNFYSTIAVTEGLGAAQSGTATTAILAASNTQADDFYNTNTIIFYEAADGTPMSTYAVVQDYATATKTVTVTGWLGGAAPVTGDLYCIFSAATLPNDQIDDTVLKRLYRRMNAQGAAGFSYGKTGARQVYSAVMSDVTHDRVYRDDLATEIQYTDNDRHLLGATGIDKAIYGFAPCVDPWSYRYDANMLPIMPFTSQSTTKGEESVFNESYLTSAEGGSAVYEVVYIVAPGIFTNESLNVNGNVGSAQFGAFNYMGSPTFLNPPTYGQGTSNPLGKKGYFYNEWIKAARPMHPENGIAVLALI